MQYTCLALWKHHVNLLLQSFRSVSSDFISANNTTFKKERVNSKSRIISTDEDPSLRIESSAIINLRGVPTKLNKCIITVCFLISGSEILK